MYTHWSKDKRQDPYAECLYQSRRGYDIKAKGETKLTNDKATVEVIYLFKDGK